MQDIVCWKKSNNILHHYLHAHLSVLLLPRNRSVKPSFGFLESQYLVEDWMLSYSIALPNCGIRRNSYHCILFQKSKWEHTALWIWPNSKQFYIKRRRWTKWKGKQKLYYPYVIHFMAITNCSWSHHLIILIENACCAFRVRYFKRN